MKNKTSKANMPEWKQKRIKELKDKLLVAAIGVPMLTVGLVTGTMGVANVVKAATPAVEKEQKYIVRYGVINGEEIETTDGNLWYLIDAPLYPQGTKVRVLFESKETKDVTDDVIIDIVER